MTHTSIESTVCPSGLLRSPQRGVFVRFPLAIALLFLGPTFVASAILDLAYDADVTLWFLVAGALCTSVGSLELRRARRPDITSAPAVMTMATLLWATIAAGGAVAHLIADATDQVDTAILEGMAAITTTSMTGLDADALPHGLLMFRAVIQWIGGLGGLILVLVVAPIVLRDRHTTQPRKLGSRSRPLITARTRGSRTVVAVYLGFSVLMTVAFVAAGMNAFDGIAHAMATVSTGGLSTRTGSLAAFDAAAVEWVAAFGMGAAGLNVGVVWWTLRGDRRNLLQSTELRAYLVMMVSTTAGIALWLGSDLSGAHAVRAASVAVTSAMSTTGFQSLGADLFDNGAQVVLVVLIGIGAMAGSAGGGFGYSRILQAFGLARRELRRQLHPTVVDVVRVDGRTLTEPSLDRLTGYVVLLFVAAASGAMIIELGDSAITPRSAIVLAVTALSTAGQQPLEPVALDTIGVASKLTLALLMLVGRLSIFIVVVAVINVCSRMRPYLRAPSQVTRP